MKKSSAVFVLIINIFLYNDVPAQEAGTPKYHYLQNFDFRDTTLCKLSGTARVIEQDGKRGVNTTSIHSVLQMKAHTLKQNNES